MSFSSRTQALTLLAVALLCGGVGGYAFRTMTESTEPTRSGSEGREWMRALHLTSEQIDTVNRIWRRNEQLVKELTDVRIGAQKDSLWEIIHPAWDSLYATIRLGVDSIRTETRAATRAVLPDSVRVRYDSMVAAADSSRRRELEQRRNRAAEQSRSGGTGGATSNMHGPPGGTGHGW